MSLPAEDVSSTVVPSAILNTYSLTNGSNQPAAEHETRTNVDIPPSDEYHGKTGETTSISHQIEKLDTSQATSGSTSPAASLNGDDGDANSKTVVSFGLDDPTNPYNWSKKKKVFIVISGILLVINSALGSSVPSGATSYIQRYWHIQNEELLVLPVSIYLIGYILGPMIFAPLSESYGRKNVMICTFVMFTVFVMATALSPNFASLVVFRLLEGIGSSTPISVTGGIYADLYNQPRARGMAMTLFMAGTTWGPIGGPLASGYIAMNASWRWVYWFQLILAGVTWPFLLLMPETFGPVILERKAKRLRKEKGDPSIVAPSELEQRDLWTLITVVLMRPLRMIFCEAIVASTCLYLALEYGNFYIFIQAFEPIFSGTYGFNPGEVGLAFLPWGVGAMVATGVCVWWDHYLEKTRNKANPPAWSQKEEYVRLPLACLGGPLIVISLFWLGWTARPDIHWIVPVLGVLPFGMGFLLIFNGLLNFVVDAYEIYSASAMGATSAARSVFGVVLPFAARPLYARLGIDWGCTLLGLLSALMCLIPFIFIRYGPTLRKNSKFCQELMQKKLEKAEQEERERRLGERQREHDVTRDIEKAI